MTRPHVVIVGGGFSGLCAARALRHAAANVTLIDRTNHHLFQPLLYQVATATLAPTDVIAPIRWLLRAHSNAEVIMADVDRVEPQRRAIVVDGGARIIAYDYLILAAGSRHSYFGHPEWEMIAPGLKSIDDAIKIRQRILLAFERAEQAGDPVERNRLLTFVIVGGGPTGVELAGMLPTIARRTLRPDYRRVDTAQARVILLEAGPRILPTFPEALSAAATAALQRLGVNVRVGTLVTSVERDLVRVGPEAISSATVVWAAGNEASHLGATLGVPRDRGGRVLVQPDLSIPGYPELFVVGDLAAMVSDGLAVPGVAPAAMQAGRRAARNVMRLIEGRPTRTFRYWNKGDLATIGRYEAVAKFGPLNVSGRLAWWLWLFVHIMELAGFRNRLSVLVEWGYAFFTYQRGARLIVGQNDRKGP